MIPLKDLDEKWRGVDDTTPPGHVLVLGVDTLGVLRLCLYVGETPADEGFRGSLLIPPINPQGSFMPRRTTAYGPRGGYVTSSGDQKAMLAQLVAEAEREEGRGVEDVRPG